MRILHITPSIGVESAGVGAVALNLVREQRVLGMESRLLCFDSPGSLDSIIGSNGLEAAIVQVRTIGHRQLAYSPEGKRWIRKWGGEFDLIHQHGIWTGASRLTNLCRKLHGSPTVVAPQGSLQPAALQFSRWKKRLALFGYERRNLNAASALQSTSDLETNEFRAFGLRNQVITLPNGIGAEWLSSRGAPDNFRTKYGISAKRRVMLFLSRIHPKKGIRFLIESLADLKSLLGEWELFLAGPEERGHRSEMEALAVELGIQESIRFVGPLYGEAKRDAFAAAELFVLPSLSENFGIVVAEALGFGVPTITTQETPWKELEETRAGWWIPLSRDSLTRALREAMQQTPNELAEMGAKGRALVASKYTWDRIAICSERIYRSLLKGEVRAIL